MQQSNKLNESPSSIDPTDQHKRMFAHCKKKFKAVQNVTSETGIDEFHIQPKEEKKLQAFQSIRVEH